MLAHHRVTLGIKFATAYLYTWMERGTVREKCCAKKHNAMLPARARNQIVQSIVQCHNLAIEVIKKKSSAHTTDVAR